MTESIASRIIVSIKVDDSDISLTIHIDQSSHIRVHQRMVTTNDDRKHMFSRFNLNFRMTMGTKSILTKLPVEKSMVGKYISVKSPR